MGRYLGTVKIVNSTYASYVNFMPFYQLVNSEFIRVTQDDRYSMFPDSEISNINLYSETQDRKSFAQQFDESALYIVDLDREYFEENKNAYGEYNKTRYKYNLDRLKPNQYGTIDVFNYHYYLRFTDASNDYSKQYLSIYSTAVSEGFSVVIGSSDGNSVAGPFRVGVRAGDGEKNVIIHDRDKRGNDRFLVRTMQLNNADTEIQKIDIENNSYLLFDSSKHSIIFKDVISDEKLLNALKDSLNKSVLKDGLLDISDIGRVVEQYKTSNLTNLPEDIRKNRLDRLVKMLSDEKALAQNFDDVCELITNMLIVQKNSELLEPVFSELAENKEFMNSVPQIQVLSSKIKGIETLIEEKQQELEAIDQEIEAKKDAELEAKLHNQYEELQNNINLAQEELNETKRQLDEIKGTLSTQEYLKKLEEDTIYLERKNEDQRKQSEVIERKIDSIFDEKTEKALNLTFDGMISQKMIQAAATWETSQQNKQYDDIIDTLIKTSRPSMTEQELIDYLCDVVVAYRPNYDKNTIINMFICIAQGFLTVFSGAPGAGKTSACNIIAHALGLLKPSTYTDTLLNVNPNRFIDVSVERGWTSKRDFIGYYNPLTKKFDRNNSRLFDALNILNIEATGKSSNRPFIVLLDEANLSPMEYYWADFMNICDDLSQNSTIDLGEDYRFVIPDELRFVATINNDHTTEALSPRLIDRAWVIRLPATKPGTGRTTQFSENDNREVLWSEFDNTFGKTDADITGVAKTVYETFVAKAKKIRIRVSPRSDSAIRRYWSVASRIMEKDESVMVDSSIIALDYAIMQKILPQISGSGDAVRNGLDELKTYAQEQNLYMTASTIEEIIEKGDESMNFYQYFG